MTSQGNSLEILGYSQAWIDAGILGESALDEQLDEYSAADGYRPTEHYRWRTFEEYVARERSVDLAQAQRIITLLAREKDRALAASCMICLLNRDEIISEAAMGSFEQACDSERLGKHFRAARIRRRLRESPLDPDALREGIESGLPEVHELLLSMALSKDQAAQLAIHGATRAIRNRARQMAYRRE